MVELFFLTGNCLCHSSALIRRACYQLLGLYDPLMRQLPDLDMWVRLCSSWEIFINPEPLLQFRLRSGNANASADISANHERANYELAKILERYSRPPLSEQLEQIFPGLFLDGETDNQRLIRLAERALEVQSAAHQLFGLDCLRELVKSSGVGTDQESYQMLKLGLETNPFSSRLNYQMTQENDALRSTIHELKEVIKSLQNRREKPWFQRAFHRWNLKKKSKNGSET
jgi:hypothetical protein